MNPKSKIPEPMKKPILLYLTTLALTALCGGAAAGQAAAQSAPDMSKYIPVSYTHLTLPTIA